MQDTVLHATKLSINVRSPLITHLECFVIQRGYDQFQYRMELYSD